MNIGVSIFNCPEDSAPACREWAEGAGFSENGIFITENPSSHAYVSAVMKNAADNGMTHMLLLLGSDFLNKNYSPAADYIRSIRNSVSDHRDAEMFLIPFSCRIRISRFTRIIFRIISGIPLQNLAENRIIVPVCYALDMPCRSGGIFYFAELFFRLQRAGVELSPQRLFSEQISANSAPRAVLARNTPSPPSPRSEVRFTLQIMVFLFRMCIPLPYKKVYKRTDALLLYFRGLKGMPLKAQVRSIKDRLTHERSGAGEMAAAVWIGIMVGISPFYGLQIIMIVFIATRFHLNRIVSFAAAHISLPFFAPILIFSSIQTGHLARYGKFASGDVNTFFTEAQKSLYRFTAEIFQTWILGSLLLGLILGAVCGVITYIIIKRKNYVP